MHLATFQLTPEGAFRPSDGRKMSVDAWVIDKESARRVIGAFGERKTPPVVDYEHQTLNAAENGMPAPAAGWLVSLEWKPGRGLFSTAELTDKAASLIRSQEYRYISPVFRFDSLTGVVTAIEMAVLTNNPAIHGMARIEMRAIDPAATLVASRSLNSEELAVCANTGISPADYARWKQVFDPANALPAIEGLSAAEMRVCDVTGISPHDYARCKHSGQPAASLGLTAEELSVCASTGISPETFSRYK